MGSRPSLPYFVGSWAVTVKEQPRIIIFKMTLCKAKDEGLSLLIFCKMFVLFSVFDEIVASTN